MVNKRTTYTQPTQGELVACAKASIETVMSGMGLKVVTKEERYGVYEVTGYTSLDGVKSSPIKYRIIPLPDKISVSVRPPHSHYGIRTLEETINLIEDALSMFHFDKSPHFSVFGYVHAPPIDNGDK